jgi:serine/threonine protein kinase
MNADDMARALDCYSDLFEMAPEARAEQLRRIEREEPFIFPLVMAYIAAEGQTEARTNPMVHEVLMSALVESDFQVGEDPYIGKIIGTYRILSLLGSGGMGTVYRAEATSYEGVVALKLIHGHVTSAQAARFEFETKTLASLVHANIAQLLYAERLPDGTKYIAMELVAGRPITSYCLERPLSLRQRLELFLQVCEAIREAHRQNIIHRDIKPSNILVREDGIAKLLDFGIAENSASIHNGPARFMSVLYAAPEQAQAPATTSADVYSLGVLLSEIITGIFPFDSEGKSAQQIRADVKAGRLHPPSSHRQSSPHRKELNRISASAWRDLDHICMKASATLPTDRYGTVGELAEEVRLYLTARPLRTMPQKWTYPLRRFIERNRWLVLAASTAVIIIAFLIVGYTIRLRSALHSEQQAAEHAVRIERFIERIFSGGQSDAGPSKDQTILSVLDQTAAETERLSGEPETQADFLQTLGSLYGELGKFDRSSQLLNLSLKIRSDKFGDASIEAARSLVEISNLQEEQEQSALAATTAQKAVAIDTTKLPVNHPDTIRAKIALAAAYRGTGKSREAISILEPVIRSIAGNHELDTELSDAENDLALAKSDLGLFDEAEAANQESMKIDSRMLGDRHPDIADHLMSIAALEDRRGNFSQAVDPAKRALQIDHDWFGDEHPETIGAMTALAGAYVELNRPQEALPLLQRALAADRKIYSGPSRALGQTLTALGRVERQLGHFNQAEADRKEVIAIYRKVNPQGGGNLAVAIANLAYLYIEQHKYRQAADLLPEAIHEAKKDFPGDDDRVLEDQTLLGVSLANLKDYQRAESFLMDARRVALARKNVDPALQNVILRNCESLNSLYQVTKQMSKIIQCGGSIQNSRHEASPPKE